MDIINKEEILARAKLKWDETPVNERERVGHKYKHFLDKFKLKPVDWKANFDDLSEKQRNVLVKGELIRWYDSLTNKRKTRIMQTLALTEFSSKWYKLPSCDKRKLLNCVIR